MKQQVADGFDCDDELNDLWSASRRGRRITVAPETVFDSGTRFYAIGSCFALEIQRFLDAQGFSVFPKMLDLSLSEGQVVGKLPEQSTLAYYTPMSILQEFEMALDGRYYGPDDFLRIEKPRNAFARRLGVDFVYQDPYRRDTYSSSLEGITDLSHRISDTIRHGIESADVFIITLGLIEGWLNANNKLWVCKCPKRDDDPEWKDLVYHRITYSEAFNAVDRLVERLAARFPRKRVLLTVSPVPLGRTFSGQDIVIANMQSKSTLRTVAGDICEKHPDYVVYWPSYEYAITRDVFEEDGHHVQRGEIEYIVENFKRILSSS